VLSRRERTHDGGHHGIRRGAWSRRQHLHVRGEPRVPRTRRHRPRGRSGSVTRRLDDRGRRSHAPRSAASHGQERRGRRVRRRRHALHGRRGRGLLVGVRRLLDREAPRGRGHCRVARPLHSLRRSRVRASGDERTPGDAAMDLVRARVALRERPLLDVLDLAVRFCVANAGSYARLSLAPFVALASRLVFDDEVRVRDVARAAVRIAPRVAVARCVQGIALGMSLALLGLPWLWLGSVMLFVPEVIILEGAGLVGAWSRAAGVASTRFGVAMAAMLLLSALVVGAALLADVAGREFLDSVLEIRPPPSIFHEGGSVLALFGFWSVLPMRATTRFFVYLDVRTRSEGWDIQTRFAALARREADETAARLDGPSTSPSPSRAGA